MKNLFITSSSKIINKRKVHKLVNILSKELEFNILSLNIIFISDKEIRELNKTYLKHDYTTDIITFNYSSDQNNLDGEIVISLDDAENNAKRYKVHILNEIGRLIIHGILHLLNYDDKTVSKRKVMKNKENKLLSSNKFVLL